MKALMSDAGAKHLAVIKNVVVNCKLDEVVTGFCFSGTSYIPTAHKPMQSTCSGCGAPRFDRGPCSYCKRPEDA